MTIYFQGNRASDFENMGTTYISESSSAGFFNSARVPNCVLISGYSSTDVAVFSPQFSGLSNLWLHYEYNENHNATTNCVIIQFMDASGTPYVRVVLSTTVLRMVQNWTGSAWNNLGTFSGNTNVLNKIDYNIITNGSNSWIYMYENKVLKFSSQFNSGSITGIAKVGFGSTGTGTSSRYSQVIIADESTINMEYHLSLPNSNGTHTGFTGDYTAVDEAISDNKDYISATAPDLMETFKSGGRNFTGYTIKQVDLSITASRSTTGPQNVKLMTRQGAIDYLQATMSLSEGWERRRVYLPNNPSTSLPWTPSEAGDANLEYGAKSIA